MTNAESAQILYTLAILGEKAYHPGWEWSVEYARRSKAHFAGVDVEDYLQQFARRESEELFEQRTLITKHVQSSMGAMLDRPFSKAARSNWTKVIAFDGDEKGDIAQRFQKEVLGRFTKDGLDAYVFERVRYWNKYDPNAFIIVEFESTDGTERARPYPFEATADQAVSFKYSVHGDLEWLAVRQVEEKPNGTAMQEVERLTLYQPRQTVVMQQLTDAERKEITTLPPPSEQIPENITNGALVYTGSKAYVVTIPPPHGLPVTPAIRAGFIDNPGDDGQTKVGIFDAALPFAEKIVKINSELDIVTAFLAFPVSVRYEDPCDAVGCDTGRLPDGSHCSVCRGSGWKARPTSAQEEILLPMPRNPQDMVDLTKILHYTYPPTDAVKMQMELMQFYFQQAKESVFNSQMFTKQETAQTATFHGIALQSVYDTIHPYAVSGLARVWKFIAEACRVFTGFGKQQMTAAMVIPHDFNFETADDLFDELKRARDAEAGNDSTAYIDERIMERLLVDNPERLARWRIDNAFNPFRGMTEAQILTALSSTMVPEWQKVWWINRQWLTQEILEETPDFYRLQTKAQRRIIMDKVESLNTKIKAEQPQIELGNLEDDNPEPQPNEQ
jgi:hypothetical protein